MANNPQYSENSGDTFADINVTLRDIEEKQNLIKDRVLLIGDNFIAEKEETEKEIAEIKNGMLKTNEEIKKLRMAIERIVEELNGFARKNEIEVISRQFEMFQPLELARVSDVEDMINRAVKNNQRQ